MPETTGELLDALGATDLALDAAALGAARRAARASSELAPLFPKPRQ